MFAPIRKRLALELNWLVMSAISRKPHLAIGGDDNPYMLRWYVIPRNRYFNIYLHRFCRSDERVKHDHPWWSLSFTLEGSYVEHICDSKGAETEVIRNVGDIVFRSAKALHYISLFPGVPCWTLFITGPVFRQWGFLYPNGQWIHHSSHVPGSVDE